MTHLEALNAGDITKIGVGVIVALVVIGVVLSMIVTAIVGRVIVLAVVVVLGVVVWQQRTSIENKIKAHECPTSTTFFGIHLDPPDSLKKVCARNG